MTSKKNDLFMLSYIVFIFICVAVRFFYNYASWNTVVAAVTAASWLFAIADIINLKVLVYADEYNTDYKEIITNIKRLSDIEDAFRKFKNSLSEIQKQQLPHSLDSIETRFSEIKKSLTALKGVIESNSKKGKRYGFFVNVFVVLGFLVFFVAVVFPTISNFLISIQEVLSVIAFGVILLTQHFGNKQIEMRNDIVKDFATMKEILDDLEETIKRKE